MSYVLMHLVQICLCSYPSLPLLRCIYKLTPGCRVTKQQDSRQWFKSAVPAPYGNILFFDLVLVFLKWLAGLLKMRGFS